MSARQAMKAISRSAAGALALFFLVAWVCPPAAAANPQPPPATEEQSQGSEDEGRQPEAAEEDEAGEVIYKTTLKWVTASELENFGFDVYRAESEDGPFTRINEKPIPGAGTTDELNRYQYVDDTIDPYKDYYYYVESISLDGERERFTPVNKVKAKLPQRETGEEGGEGG